MASNQYIKGYTSNSAHKLADDLVSEAIRFYGHDIIYIPRNGINKDKIFNEFEYSDFDTYYEVEVYVKNVQSFGGDGQFLSKFSLEIRDQITLTMSVKSFNQFIGTPSGFLRPREGDLIYIPFLTAAYEIRFVENAAIFYQTGKFQSWDLTVEVFEYSNESFNTGIPEIDNLYNSQNYLDTANLESVEAYAQNQNIQDEANTVMDWTELDPFSESEF